MVDIQAGLLSLLCCLYISRPICYACPLEHVGYQAICFFKTPASILEYLTRYSKRHIESLYAYRPLPLTLPNTYCQKPISDSGVPCWSPPRNRGWSANPMCLRQDLRLLSLFSASSQSRVYNHSANPLHPSLHHTLRTVPPTSLIIPKQQTML